MDDVAPAERPAGPAEPVFDTFAALITPVDVETFHQEYWERRHLIVRRDDSAFYDRLLTLADLDAILSASSLRSSDLRVVNQGRDTPVGDTARAGAADPDSAPDERQAPDAINGLESLYRHYREGATISLTFLHERWPALADLCRSLAVEFSAGFQTNVYLTPAGGAQGLSPHHDTHDVFVAQIHGTKRWRFYPSPVPLPLRNQQYRPPDAGPGEPIEEFDLNPGDLLYMPRGQVHAATSGETASLHLTIGVLPVLWSDVLREAVDRRLAAEPRFRRSLPVGFAHDERLRRECEQRVVPLLRELVAEAPAEELMAEAVRRAWSGRQPVLRGHLLDLEAVPSLTLETAVRRRPGLLYDLSGITDADPVELRFHGKTVRLPARVAEEVEYAATAATFTGKDIPGGLDEEGRLVLIHSLLREGFLTIAR